MKKIIKNQNVEKFILSPKQALQIKGGKDPIEDGIQRAEMSK